MKLLTALVAAVGFFVFGCASAPKSDPVELAPIAQFDVAFNDEPGQQALEDLPQYTVPDAPDATRYEIEIRVVCGPVDEVAEYFGSAADSVKAWETTEPGLNKKIIAMQRGGLEVQSLPTLTAVGGARGLLAITPQISYVAGFAAPQPGFAPIERHPKVIRSQQLDCLVELMATKVDESTVELSLQLTLLDERQTMDERDVLLGGETQRAQSPVLYSKSLQCKGRLSEEKVLVVTGMTERNRAYVLMLKPARKAAIVE